VADDRVSRVAVVTGGASGIGLAISRRLADRGDRVAVFDRDADAAERAAEEIRSGGGEALGAGVDVTDREGLDGALDKVRSEFGPVGIMVTSAGIAETIAFTDLTLEDWERVMRVNLTGTFNSLQPVVPDMIDAGWGRIVTISSSSAQSGAPGMAHYSASKGGVIALTKTLAVELGRYGITVNTIPPRAVDTPMLRKAATFQDADEVLQQIGARMPVGRAGVPDDIAAACVFLCSADAGYITGQVIGVNGGGYI
jgi:2-hydroxycyclohexanecarboxyl-CoA dehydrogenase